MLRRIKQIVLVFTVSFFSIFAFSQESAENELELLENPESIVNQEVDPALQHNFTIIENVSPHELNPQITTYASDSQLLSGLYEGLFSYNPVTLEPQYAIAINYRISRDKKRWTIKLREDARFSNGEYITAQNVKDSWLQLLSTPEAPYASMLDVIKGAALYREGKIKSDGVGISVVSKNELAIILEKPANYLPKLLCHSSFSIIHRNPTVYSGAFYVDDYTENHILLKKNPFYWDAANTNLEQITIIQSDDAEENTFAFNTGLADWVLGEVNLSKILNKKAFQMNAEFATSYLFFKNSAGKPVSQGSVWDFVEFRRALFEIMPWEELRSGYYVPATTFVYPLHNYPEIEGYAYTDKNEAKFLMQEARKKYNIPQDKIIPLVLEISENSFTDEKLVSLKKAFEEIGVELKVRTLPVYYYLGNVSKSNADLFCYTWIGDFADPLAFLELFKSTSTLNDAHWINAEFDELLEKAATVTESERYKLLGQAEEILLDSCEVVPIHHPVTVNVINLEEVGGWASNAFDLHPLKFLYKKSSVLKVPNIVKN